MDIRAENPPVFRWKYLNLINWSWIPPWLLDSRLFLGRYRRTHISALIMLRLSMDHWQWWQLAQRLTCHWHSHIYPRGGLIILSLSSFDDMCTEFIHVWVISPLGWWNQKYDHIHIYKNIQRYRVILLCWQVETFTIVLLPMLNCNSLVFLFVTPFSVTLWSEHPISGRCPGGL